MTYLKKPSLSQQQQELRELIDERLKNEESKVKERVYQWLNDNQYFVDECNIINHVWKLLFLTAFEIKDRH